MDVVSDAIAAARRGAPHGSLTAEPESWGWWFPPSAGAGFHAVLAGRCWLHSSAGEPIELAAGDIVFLAQGAGHGLSSGLAVPLMEEPERPVEMAFPRVAPKVMSGAAPEVGTHPAFGGTPRPELLCGAYSLVERQQVHPLFQDLPGVVRVHVDQHPALNALLRLLVNELRSSRPGSPAAAAALLDATLVHLIRAALDHPSQPDQAVQAGRGRWAEALADPVVAAALQAIHTQPGEPWTVGALARIGGASRSTFSERFSRLVGQTPMLYVTWWRMACAARLLDSGDPGLTVAEIARRVGYKSEFAFSKAFKRWHDSAPSRFRKDRRPS